MDRKKLSPHVVSLKPPGRIAQRIGELGVPIDTLGISHGTQFPFQVFRIRAMLRKIRPSVIQGWMYHANVVATLAAGLARGRIPVLWGVRASLHGTELNKASTDAIIRVSSCMSSYPRFILFNSRESLAQHVRYGFHEENCRVIPNGFDTEVFVPRIQDRSALRRSLGLPEAARLIGLVARYHEVKGHSTFLRAAALLSKTHPDVRFVLVGAGVDASNREIWTLIEGFGLDDRTVLMGERADVQDVTAALDVATSCSYSEAFCNVIGEAMACGVPCVVTGVGDSAWIVGNTGVVVPPRDAAALAEGWRSILDMHPDERIGLGARARAKIIEYFSLDAITRCYEAICEEACGSVPRHSSLQ